MTDALPPLRFKTQFKERIWGGQRIRTLLGKDFSPLPNCGETWELSSVPGSVSQVEAGPLAGRSLIQALETYGAELCGARLWETHGPQFPLLVKFLDAADDLSIQVHPDDALAQKRHGCAGKTEMWYVFAADPGSRLISGFREPVDRAAYQKAIAEDRLPSILQSHPIAPGDVFFLPAGRVHAIGKGICLAEIQQSSDITYRLFDYHRVDAKTGRERELHTDAALDATDFSPVAELRTRYEPRLGESVTLVRCSYFHTRLAWFDRPMPRTFDGSSCTIYINVSGSATVRNGAGSVDLAFGECCLMPAHAGHWTLEPKGETKLLEVRVE
ncbi:MAG: class I mannose-6-phosphate isomerase [Spirochaetes bacterium]|nr:class I mannose-6-phosphate isomerase [Spirochaetota bacterium]